MEVIIRVITSCRSCGSEKLLPILSLGEIYVSNFIESDSEGVKSPLELVLCKDCGLLQLRHTTNPEILYRKYWYKSGINEAIVKDLQDIATKAEKLVSLKKGDIVLDIGSNDSSLLRSYQTEGLRLVGFEPATNLIEEARKGTTLIINDFFNYESFKKNFGDEKAKVISTIAMFYDIDDPNKFVKDIVKILDEDGVWVLEQRYLPLMLEQNDIGNICHEHLEYYSLMSLKNLLSRHALEIFYVELNQVNGGSFRTYVRHEGSSVKPFLEGSVEQLENWERIMELQISKPYELFAARVESIKKKLCNFVKSEHHRGKIIHIYGASTKGNILLQYFGLDHTVIEAAAERDHRKVGKKTVGTGIPIITEEESRQRADYFLVLIWHFKNGILQREREFLKSGGKLVFPLPDFEVIGWDDIKGDTK